MQLNLRGHFLGFHLRIPLLKFSNKLVHLRREGTRFQTIVSKYQLELEPFQTVFHCLKTVRIRSYFAPHFPALGLNK